MRALPWLVPVAGKQACSLGIELIQMMPRMAAVTYTNQNPEGSNDRRIRLTLPMVRSDGDA